MLTDLFKIGIWQVDLDLDNDSIANYCHTLQQQDSVGRIVSNQGGWQSKPLVGEHPHLNTLFTSIIEQGVQYANSIGLTTSPTTIDDIWVNMNKQHAYNSAHCHPGSILSGVYYVHNTKLGGDIVFDCPNSALINGYWWNAIDKEVTDYTSSQHTIQSSIGKLILFPSWLTHFVQPNNHQQEERISISFNLN